MGSKWAEKTWELLLVVMSVLRRSGWPQIMYSERGRRGISSQNPRSNSNLSSAL